jgi:hypothetical protein
MEKTVDANGREHLEPRTKTEIREITHLHHALDACVLGLAAASVPNNGEVWRALLERRPNPAQRALLEPLDLGEFDASGRFILRDLPESLKQQLRTRLAERRVVQHVPADMSGIRVEENTRGIVKREDGRVWLRQRKANAKARIDRNAATNGEQAVGLPSTETAPQTRRRKASASSPTISASPSSTTRNSRPRALRHPPLARLWQKLKAQLRNGGKRP